MKLWHRKSDVVPGEARAAKNQATLMAGKSLELLARDCELAAKEAEHARHFRDRRISNGFIEMIEEILVPESKES